MFRNTTTTTYLATLEQANAASEAAHFANLDSVRHIDVARARTGVASAWLNANNANTQALGPVRTMPVHRGDTVKLEAFAYYEQVNQNFWPFNLSVFIANTFGSAPGVEGDNEWDNLSICLVFTPQTSTQSNGVPNAYMKFIVYDLDSNVVAQGEQLITTAANTQWEALNLSTVITQDGYIKAYLINEDDEDVWFDDFTLTHITSPIVQEQAYYPFGLTFNTYNKSSAQQNRYLYNGKEIQINWSVLDFDARMHDAALGRFMGIDLLAEEYSFQSTYAYAANNPIKYVDLHGMGPSNDGFWKTLFDKARKYAKTQVKKAIRHTVKQVKKDVQEFANDIEVSPYIKADTKVTTGGRVALETEDGTGYDVNVGSYSYLSAGIEVDKSSLTVDVVNPTKEVELTQGISAGKQVGAIGYVPISVNGGTSREIRYLSNGNDFTFLQEKKEVAASSSITGTPIGIFASGEQAKTSEGKTTTVFRLSPFTFGKTIAVVWGWQWSVSAGVKITHTSEEK